MELTTALGSGNTMTIRLPVTLAIIHALLAKIEGEIYALPITHVVETMVLTPAMSQNRATGRRCSRFAARLFRRFGFARDLGIRRARTVRATSLFSICRRTQSGSCRRRIHRAAGDRSQIVRRRARNAAAVQRRDNSFQRSSGADTRCAGRRLGGDNAEYPRSQRNLSTSGALRSMGRSASTHSRKWPTSALATPQQHCRCMTGARIMIDVPTVNIGQLSELVPENRAERTLRS